MQNSGGSQESDNTGCDGGLKPAYRVSSEKCGPHFNDLIEFARSRLLSEARCAKMGRIFQAEQFDRFAGLFRGYAAILLHHGAPMAVVLAAGVDVMNYLGFVTEAVFFKRAKWLNALMMARFLRNPLPTQPDDCPFKPTGCFRRWVNPRLLRYSRRNSHLWFSWFQCKRAALPLTSEEAVRGLFKHRAAMLKQDPCPPWFATRVVDMIRPLLKELGKKIVKDLGQDRTRFDVRQASLSSSYESTRKEGGQAGRLSEELKLYQGLDSNNDLFRMDELRPDEVVEGSNRRVRVVKTNSWNLSEWLGDVTDIDSRGGVKQLARSFVGGAQPLPARISQVFEPLKLRTVSSGPAAVYYTATEFQRSLHSHLRVMKCFRAIGRPLSPTDVSDVEYGPGVSFVSADYETSTDCLSSGVSHEIVDELSAPLPHARIYAAALEPHEIEYPTMCLTSEQYGEYCNEMERWLTDEERQDYIDSLVPLHNQFLSSFGEKLDMYCLEPTKRRKFTRNNGETYRALGYVVVVPSVFQINGQLMGSPVSFNILCLANLAGYLASRVLESRVCPDSAHNEASIRAFCLEAITWEITPDERELMKKCMDTVLINGDDLLSGLTDLQFEFFWIMSSMIGLKLSVGKTYKHKRYANMNSTSFDVQDISCPVQIDYLNTGLLFGQNKVLKKIDTDSSELDLSSLAPHIAVIDRVIQGCLPGKECSLLANYIHMHRDALLLECRGRNLFVARSLGGFGVRLPSGFNFEMTASQKCEAFRLFQGTVDAQRPSLRRYEMIVERDAVLCPWDSNSVESGTIPKLRKAISSGIEWDQLHVDPTIERVPSWVFR